MVCAIGAPQPAAQRTELERGMDALRPPALGPAAEQTRRRAYPPRSAPAVAHQTAADVVVEGDQEMARLGAGDGGADFRGERFRDPLVGVDLEHPVAGAGGDAGVASRALDRPRALDHPRGETPGDLGRGIGGAVEDDHQIVGEAQAFEAVAELRRFVAGDDQDRQAGRAHLAPSSSWRRNSALAAASTASTPRVSIKVSWRRWS